MKTVGIIGGIAPESTIVYYKEIVNAFIKLTDEKVYPKIIINSIDMKKMLGQLNENKLDELTEYILEETEKLVKAGADFGLLASNTPHIVFNRIKEKSSLPMISIVEATCRKAKNLGLKKVCLLGTKFTMRYTFYHDVFLKEDIKIVTPDDGSQDYIHKIYFAELVRGIFLDETKQNLLRIVDKMIESENIEGVILGGTELPLILKDGDRDIPFLDTTMIHVEEVIKEMMG
ncbi:MAG: amino acid racemase [Ignavibacteriales bacterium]|nr:MAG: amino acid racemase [Ignavibacteriales bacterium]